jgi:hypothetical protein
MKLNDGRAAPRLETIMLGDLPLVHLHHAVIRSFE